MTRIYTRGGDAGETGFLGKGRLKKSDPRIEALGSIDEVNSALGLVLASSGCGDELRELLERTQNILFHVGAAAAAEAEAALACLPLLKQETEWLEQWMDAIDAKLDPLTQFILPGGSQAGSLLHWSRTVSRRAERALVSAFAGDPDRGHLLTYVNRLSDALFVAARLANRVDGVRETTWESSSKGGEAKK